MMGGLSYMTGPDGRPAARRHLGQRHHGRHVRRHRRAAALRERDRTGRGQEVQSALFENCVFLAAQHMQQYSMTGEAPPPMPSRVSAWSVYDVFTLAGRRPALIGAVSDKQFLTLCRCWKRRSAAEPAFATNAQRVAVRPELLAQLGEILRHHRIDELSPSSKPPAFPMRRSCVPTSCFTTRT